MSHVQKSFVLNISMDMHRTYVYIYVQEGAEILKLTDSRCHFLAEYTSMYMYEQMYILWALEIFGHVRITNIYLHTKSIDAIVQKFLCSSALMGIFLFEPCFYFFFFLSACNLRFARLCSPCAFTTKVGMSQ